MKRNERDRLLFIETPSGEKINAAPITIVIDNNDPVPDRFRVTGAHTRIYYLLARDRRIIYDLTWARGSGSRAASVAVVAAINNEALWPKRSAGARDRGGAEHILIIDTRPAN